MLIKFKKKITQIDVEIKIQLMLHLIIEMF